MVYANAVLNLRVDQRYANDQYQDEKEIEVFKDEDGREHEVLFSALVLQGLSLKCLHGCRVHKSGRHVVAVDDCAMQSNHEGN